MNTRLLKNSLLEEIKQCQICSDKLAHGINPVVSFSDHSQIAIVGQAPGRKVHESGIPWDDKSGERLRSWLGVSDEQFYDSKIFALIPMGFCYPGTGKSGDLPPRKECAPAWHSKVFDSMPNISLRILIGKYAVDHYLKHNTEKNLTETIKQFHLHLPQYLVLPHPSPRNNIWLKKNSWFEKEIVPHLQERVHEILKLQK